MIQSARFPGHEPFALAIGGKTTIVVRDTRQVSEMWRNTVALTFDPFVEGVFKAFGMPKAFVRTVFTERPASLISETDRSKSLLVKENPTGKCYVHLQSEWFKYQLLQKGHLDHLQSTYNRYLTSHVAWKTLTGPFVEIDRSSTSGYRVISLARFSRYIISQCSFKTFMGDRLLEFAPSFAANYQKYEDDSWKIFYQLPPMFARDLHAAKDRAIESLAEYLSLPEKDSPGVAWIFRTMFRELGYLNVATSNRSGIIMMILWAINNNAHHIAFWILVHLVNDRSLYNDVQQEIDGTFLDTDANNPSVEHLVTSCPHLDSVWHECLRFYNNASAVRRAKATCTVGSTYISEDSTLIAPFRQFHSDKAIFGPDAHVFDARRFIKNKNLRRAKGYAPFGGGNTYCPGRLFAQREIYLVVAHTLRRFYLSLPTSKQDIGTGHVVGVPEVDLKKPAAAAMGPSRDVKLVFKPRVL